MVCPPHSLMFRFSRPICSPILRDFADSLKRRRGTRQDCRFWTVSRFSSSSQHWNSFRTRRSCHTDLTIQAGGIPSAFPSIQGHEGSGIVEKVGSAVANRFTPGDKVLLSFASCESCTSCQSVGPNLLSHIRQIAEEEYVLVGSTSGMFKLDGA